jgi:hypothetical protein
MSFERLFEFEAAADGRHTNEPFIPIKTQIQYMHVAHLCQVDCPGVSSLALELEVNKAALC